MMTASSEPLVCVLTPVYNGAEYLAEGIESLRAQTYRNYRHIIINNRSTDRTLEIAQEYAAKDPRIEVHTNDTFVGLMENHNIAFRRTPADAKYCKILSADDTLLPTYLERMVAAAEANPSAGFVGCYQFSGTRIRWQGFPYPRTLIDGRELCRKMLHTRDSSFGFGTPTSLLCRADLVRKSNAFYPNNYAHADTSVMYRYLAESDFAFVYEILCVERLDPNSATPRAARMREEYPCTLSDIVEYGDSFLLPDEKARLVADCLKGYHEVIAADLMALKGKEFLDYHRKRLEELGFPLTTTGIVTAGARKLLREAANPQRLISKLIGRQRRPTNPGVSW